MRGQTLREAADRAQNGQVFYRMEEHLLPTGLAQEAARTERNRHVEPRQFRLTEECKEWVEEHADALAISTTREEAAESARSSVQNYRKKLHRVKGRVDGLDEEVEEIASAQEGMDMQQVSLSRRSQQNEERSKETTETVKELREWVSEVEDTVARLEEEAALRERANRSWWDRLMGR